MKRKYLYFIDITNKLQWIFLKISVLEGDKSAETVYKKYCGCGKTPPYDCTNRYHEQTHTHTIDILFKNL